MVNSNLKNYKLFILQTVHRKKLARIHLLPNKSTFICVHKFIYSAVLNYRFHFKAEYG